MSDEAVAEPRSLPATLVRLALWLATAAVGTMAASQAFGTTVLSVLFVLQSLTPYVAVGTMVLVMATLVLRMWWAAVVDITALAGLVVLMLPIVGDTERPAIPDATPRLVMAMANVYYENQRIDEAAARLLTLDADLLAVVEHNPAAAAALEAAGVTERYPYRSEMPRDDRTGLVLFSRLPIVSSVVAPIGRQLGITAVVDVDGRSTRVLVVHPVPGTVQSDVSRWSDDLAAIGRAAAESDLPTVVVGDFNASRWHPAFRHLLGTGLVDAHEQVGKGWSRSWPADRFVPAFVRIDHALLRNGLVAVDVLDIEVPGSDHVGFVVTLALPATSD